jgi:hypothetical protein
MPDYTKGNIYKLCCRDTDITNIYIGSTCNMTKRKHKHKYSCNNEKAKGYNYYVYRFIRENGGWNNWNMVLVEEVCCENKKQLNQKERECIEKLKPTLNKVIPNRTQKEYYQDNFERERERQKEYYKENKESIQEKIKKYHNKNKNKINEYKKKWYENNSERILEKRKKRIICECGREISVGNLIRHKRQDIHKRLMNEL